MVVGLAVTERQILFAHGRESFAISDARMPFPTALLDFMITALGFGAVDHLLAPRSQGPCRKPQMLSLGRFMTICAITCHRSRKIENVLRSWLF